MTRKTWAKIRRGDVVELGGRDWTVERIKAGKKKADVRVRSGSRTAESRVRLDEKVRIAAPPKPEKKPKRPAATPPKTPHGDPWETQQDRVERKLDELLSARLVGESTDGGEAYYVPPVDVTTIAAHLAIFHAATYDQSLTAGEMLAQHEREHAAALAGDHDLVPHHWHTELRPTTGKKGKKK